MIKPDAVADGHIGAILEKSAEGGFKIKALKLTQLTVADAKNSTKYTPKDLSMENW
jgi:nucleoside-diphosphate kinase